MTRKGKKEIQCKNSCELQKGSALGSIDQYFQIEWASKYPFIEPTRNPKEGKPPVECRYMICIMINIKEKRL